MEHYRVVKDTRKGQYFLVSAGLIKKEPIEPVRFEILKEDNPTAGQMLEEFAVAPIIDYEHLVCESEHYLFYASFRRHFYDWTIVKK